MPTYDATRRYPAKNRNALSSRMLRSMRQSAPKIVIDSL